VVKPFCIVEWYGLSKWQLSQYQNVHVSDAWRLAVLYKFGGTYLDNDIVTLRPTTCLKNFISIQSDDGIPNHAFSTFDRGYTWLKELMGRFTREYNHQQWDYNGPQLLNRDIVGKRSIGNLPRDLTIGPKEAFYRIHWNDAPKLFKPSEELARGLAEKEQIWNDLHSEETYGVHLWNAASKSMRINQRSVLASVFQLHCPTTFAKMQRLYNWV
jgi:lactosylceramide 4-alpha-galactosyltransferase